MPNFGCADLSLGGSLNENELEAEVIWDHEVRKQVGLLGERVEARECRIARADHQGNQINCKTGQDWRRVPEDHRHAVHAEDLVEGLRPPKVLVWQRELNAHDERLNPAYQKKHHRGCDIAFAEFLP